MPGDVQVFQTWGPDFYEGPNYIIRVVARLGPAMTIDSAQRDFDRVAEEIRAGSSEFARENLRFRITGMQADAFRDVRPALTALFAGGAFVLLICCVNVTGLLLARGNDRRREIAFRLAVGASRGRIVSQLLAEAAVLGAAGGLARCCRRLGSVPWAAGHPSRAPGAHRRAAPPVVRAGLCRPGLPDRDVPVRNHPGVPGLFASATWRRCVRAARAG